MELQIDFGFPQGSDDIKILTPMELQIDMDFATALEASEHDFLG